MSSKNKQNESMNGGKQIFLSDIAQSQINTLCRLLAVQNDENWARYSGRGAPSKLIEDVLSEQIKQLQSSTK
tara:strand:+ start:349 stop:564 length:216 start_codon:yes stop_codon:yes gene_type:complete